MPYFTNRGIIPLPTGGGAYAGPGDVATLANWKCWWGLRGFSAAYADGTNNALRLDNSASSDPHDILILADGSLDVATAAPLVATHKVSILYAQTGDAANDLVQTTHALRPSLVISGLNGLPILTFVNQYLRCSSIQLTPAVSIDDPSAYSLVARGSSTTQAGTQYTFLEDPGAGNGVYSRLIDHADLWRVAGSAGGSAEVAATDDDFHAAQIQFNGASSFAYIDGTNTGITLTAGANTVQQGGQFDFGHTATISDICEGGVYDGDITSFRSALNSQQTTYWGPF